MRLAVVFLLVAAGCAKGGPGTSGGNPDLALSMNSICPAHPAQCGGKCCGASCVEISVDIRNCGDCAHACDPGQLCAGGGCGCPPTGTICSNGQSCCGAAGCKSLASDVNNCMSCGHSCLPLGDRCSNSTCLCGSGPACTGGQQCCGGACSSSCAQPPDMATATGDGGAGNLCQCAGMCPLSKFCVGPNCCFEQAFAGACMPSSSCTPQMYP